jgi:surface antigen
MLLNRMVCALATAVVAMSFSCPVFAQNSLFLANGPLGHITKTDKTIALAAIRAALESGSDGHTYTWSNSATGASGTVTPVKTYKKNGMACRRADFTTYAGGERGGSAWNLCKTSAGWKIDQ